VPLNAGTDLLKNEESVIDGLKRVIMNRWAGPKTADYYYEKAELQREK
jgi:hypothetical protein